MNPISYKEYVPIAVFIALVALSIFILKPLLISLILGSILAYAVYPLYHKISFSSIKNKSAAATLVCVLVLLILIVPAIFLIKGLVQESYTLYQFVRENVSPSLLEGCQTWWCGKIQKVFQNEAIMEQIQTLSIDVTGWLIGKGSAFLVSIPRLLLHLFIIFFTMFYFLKDGESLVGIIGEHLQLRRGEYSYIIQRLQEILSGIIYGYLLIGLIQGVLGALGFFLFGLSSPLFWGMVMGFLALIPFLGAGLVWLPAAIFVISQGVLQDSSGLMFKGIGLAAYGLLIISGVDNVLRPKLIGSKAKIHPAIILLGIFGGVLTMGAIGVILGPLLLSLTVVLMDVFLGGKKYFS